MAETETKIEALEKEVNEASANPQADAPKKNAVAAEPTHLSNEAEDLGSAVTNLQTLIQTQQKKLRKFLRCSTKKCWCC